MLKENAEKRQRPTFGSKFANIINALQKGHWQPPMQNQLDPLDRVHSLLTSETERIFDRMSSRGKKKSTSHL